MSRKEVPLDNASPFTDTDDKYVAAAYALGVTAGTSADAFSPDLLLNREQAAVMLTRVYKKLAFDAWSLSSDSSFDLEFEQTKEFTDDGKISDWAKNSVYFMAANGIIKGVSETEFAPKNTTEEEAALGYANATREAAILLAARTAKLELPEKIDATIPDPYQDVQEAPIKPNDPNAYTVAFIGGSLTEGGALWISNTKSVLEQNMPDKTIYTLNAGKGGTTSAYGAARFMEDVGQYEPDMVVIEFAVNDRYYGEENSKIYMESLVRQCLRLPKVPVVVFVYAPLPYDKDSDTYASWANGVAWKEEIARHYGIKSINVYDYMQRDYNNIKDEKGYATFRDYLNTMYSGTDAHGGYQKYGEAIIEAFSNDFNGCMTVPLKKEVYCTEKRDIVEARYKQLMITNPAIYYLGEWETYTKYNPLKTDDPYAKIPVKHFSYPFFTEGEKQVVNKVAAFGFMSKAAAFSINYTSSSAGSNVKVYIDGTQATAISCYSENNRVNYNSDWVSLPNDGKEHKVILSVEEPTADKYVFRFGSVIERFTK
ncbi:MAG: S-layer homology domain-containing protein [Clostridia bacterium]|nr:S-layer homology domain-containing protein [Clostridia bacterium]